MSNFRVEPGINPIDFEGLPIGELFVLRSSGPETIYIKTYDKKATRIMSKSDRNPIGEHLPIGSTTVSPVKLEGPVVFKFK
jgi:hypothetical protein